MTTPRATALLLLLLAFSTGTLAADGSGLSGPRSVTTLIGVDGIGNIVPGPQVPFGFANPSPDNVGGATSGYDARRPLLGFSLTHVSGTGGYGKYGNVRLTPTTGAVEPMAATSGMARERARPGYYRVDSTRFGVTTELTATRMTAIARFRFPATASANVLVDACSFATVGQTPLTCVVHVVPPNRIEGRADMYGGWNPSPYTLYFSARFDRDFVRHGTFYGRTTRAGSTYASNDDPVLGAYATFDARTQRSVTVDVGLSFVSVAAAREHVKIEAGAAGFDALRARAELLWQRALATITVAGGTPSQRAIFSNALYQAQRAPHDLSGENAWWTSDEPHYEDYYALWDTFRTLNPLLTLIQPARQRDIVRSLVDTYRHTGWMPDARIAGANGLVQGGSNADVVLADAAVKDLRGIDYATAYAAMRKNAEEQPSHPVYEGRHSIALYKALGFLPYDTENHAASRTLEYAYDDFCIAEVAALLGRDEDAKKYRARAHAWNALWDERTGAIRPRRADGGWLAPFDREQVYPDTRTGFTQLESPFHEGSAYQYSMYVPHDVSGLIRRVGGDAHFVRWLDRFFENAAPRTARFRPGRFDGVQNEHDFLAPFLYVHAGRPDRTDQIVRRTLATSFHATRSGWPGNDDSGAISSWYVWNAIGLYPNAGQPYYYVGSPVFRRAAIALGTSGKTFVVEAPATSSTNQYIASATLNNHSIDRAYITHAELIAGGILKLRMSSTPTTWAHTQRPPRAEVIPSESEGSPPSRITE